MVDSGDSASLKTVNFLLPTALLTPLDATLTDTPFANSFACHSYEKSRGVGEDTQSPTSISLPKLNPDHRVPLLLPTPVAPRGVTPYSEDSTAMKRIYLDHNATTPVDAAVLDAMLPFFSGEFGNASSIHTFGQRARAAVETAREQVAALINARAQEIIFTSGGTESDNHAIFGIVAASLAAPSTTPPHIITTAIEHEAVLNACQALEKQGAAVTYLPVNRDGLMDLAELRSAIRPETVLITVMHANNELGTVQPLAEIGQIAAQHDIYFHTDAVQSVGKIPVDAKNPAARPAGALRTQALRTKRCRRKFHQRRNAAEAASLRRASPAGIPARHRKCAGNRGLGQSCGTGEDFARDRV